MYEKNLDTVGSSTIQPYGEDTKSECSFDKAK